MNVESMRLINFRNYKNISLKFHKNINIFIGKNAQGKTNLMEAIYMCAIGRSFRTNKDKEIINFEKNEAYIGANVSLGDYKKFFEIKMERNKPKRIRVNKTELASYKELNTGLNVVIFTPEDLKIVKGGPQERRNFIDSGVSQIKPVYSYNINKYKKLLYQRNNLLKSSRFRKDINNLLEVFDLQIAKIGTSIILERDKYLQKLSDLASFNHTKITDQLENLNLKYMTNVPILENKGDMEKAYLELMKKNLKKDLEFGTTEIGPHRDDIIMMINNKDARIYGSQGQQRTTVLSIILSELELIKRERGMYPVLLLDDVFSELDGSRRKYLTDFFNHMQVFITVTDGEDLKSMENLNKTIYYIENGNLKLENSYDSSYR
ncbi:DNA replication/repair protein RecF [Wansuia hejianensis]|uniref:DNA replication and repair protein RecF n=1 Tax=Wansuia hejianensis TaxID=2763667 RepID=A0A926INN9_9FIRM|nr:DNA replication/repair protein RecF [Wansuia hejianensis]MBC8590878.1 DNA replication/repair protein RecF [Wansuia hejianensis]